MVRHNNLSERIIPPQDDMAALLPLKIEARFFQGVDTLTARNLGSLLILQPQKLRTVPQAQEDYLLLMQQRILELLPEY